MRIRVLVTGAGGQLGKTIQDLESKYKEVINFTFTTKQELDITDTFELEKCFSTNKFEYCINCAAYTNVEQAEKTPEIAYKINAESVKNLAKVCKDCGVVLIHISTDYVFDGEKREPYTVYDLPNPINEYGKSKLLGVQYIQEILQDYFIVRTSWLYSKKFGKNFYRTIIEKTKTATELFITEEQTGCPTDTINLTKYLVKLIKKKKNNFGVHHFCNGVEMTWFDFAFSILTEHDLLDRISLVRIRNYRTFAKRPKYSVLKASKIVD